MDSLTCGYKSVGLHAQTPGNVVRPLMLKQSSTEIIRSLTAEKKVR